MLIGRKLPRRPLALGAIVTVLALVVGAVSLQRHVITTVLGPGDTLQATFERDYRLRSYVSEVKIAGVPVGTVTGVRDGAGGEAVVSMKLDSGITEKLGSAPSAEIRPATLLGGKYFVELAPGGLAGTPDGDIPVSRTRVPVELDAVVESLQPDARAGARQFADKVDGALEAGADRAVADLVAEAPAALEPAAPVLDAVAGAHPDSLRTLVVGLDATGRVLTAQEGQLEAILADLDATARSLDRSRRPLADAIVKLPETLRATRSGVTALGGSLKRLTETADALRPVAAQLNPLLTRLEPVTAEARPVVADLRVLLADARPLVEDLVPTTVDTTEVLDNLGGEVLDRVNGPIVTALNTPFDGTGTGRYEDSNSPYLLYQDIAYAFTNGNGAASYTDANGTSLVIQVGTGPDGVADVQGVPNLENFFRQLIGAQESPR